MQARFQPVAEVVEVPAEYELAMESALGPLLQMLLSEDTVQVLGAVGYLKEQKSGRSSFMAAASGGGLQMSGFDSGAMKQATGKSKI